MKDADCVAFLQWALPRMGMRWPGFRKVRGQVCKRIRRRVEALELQDLEAYRSRLGRDPGEWAVLDACCRVTISRFFRDRGVWRHLGGRTLPDLLDATARTKAALRAWSVGCASGEEPYSLALLWHLDLAKRAPGRVLDIVGTDSDPVLLERCARACYPGASIRNVPAEWREAAFRPAPDDTGECCLDPALRATVDFRLEDVRRRMPGGPFHLILCRNLVFTYFDDTLQRRILAGLLDRLATGGRLVLGGHETLPSESLVEEGGVLGSEGPGLPVYRLVSAR